MNTFFRYFNSFLFTGLMALVVSCVSPKHNNDEMKTEHITSFSFDHHNSMAMFQGEKYNVTTMKDGRVHVVIDEGFPAEKEFYLTDATIFDELQAIVKAFKTDNYEGEYKPKFTIYDGDSWSLYYRYDSQRSVSSGGYMAWPSNYREMRQALSDYFRKWREYQEGVLAIDYFRFTYKNRQGSDKEYTLERGEDEATMTLRDAELGIDKTLKVSNDNLQELQEMANTVKLKDKIYDYVTNDEDATRCTYFVRFNTGDSISGTTCHTQYPSHKVSGILEFFSKWLNEQ